MGDAPRGPIKVKVMDKRRGAQAEAGFEPASAPADGDERIGAGAAEAGLLDDLRRLQAEFDNYRKRVLREQTAMASRASQRLVERLLPVLDNFERAMEHGEGGPGIELVYKELRQTLEQEGLEEIEAEGAPFDPRLHEAFQVIDDADASEPVVKIVYRRGYRLGDAVLRPAMVVVARPLDDSRGDGRGGEGDGVDDDERAAADEEAGG
jgi:molecular chaperone GrpE